MPFQVETLLVEKINGKPLLVERTYYPGRDEPYDCVVQKSYEMFMDNPWMLMLDIRDVTGALRFSMNRDAFVIE